MEKAVIKILKQNNFFKHLLRTLNFISRYKQGWYSTYITTKQAFFENEGSEYFVVYQKYGEVTRFLVYQN